LLFNDNRIGVRNMPHIRRHWRFTAITSCLAALTNISAAQAQESKPSATEPVRQAHAHNDYEHKRPLFDALDQGFCSVEADIYLVDGKLLVAHDRDEVRPERTLQALYLDPLRERVKKNHGRVYPDGPEFTLLIDLKSDWRKIYPALRAVLKDYADMLTVFHAEASATNAITAI